MITSHRVFIAGFLFVFFVMYSFILYLFPAEDKSTISPEALKGKLVWQEHNCNSCHQVYGLGGFLGPDLTNVYARRSPEYINGILESGINSMPDFELNEAERNNLVAYLKYMNTTGESDPRTFTLNSDGTISK